MTHWFFSVRSFLYTLLLYVFSAFIIVPLFSFHRLNSLRGKLGLKKCATERFLRSTICTISLLSLSPLHSSVVVDTCFAFLFTFL